MSDKHPYETKALAIHDVTTLLEEAARSIWPIHHDDAERPASYRIAAWKETVLLNNSFKSGVFCYGLDPPVYLKERFHDSNRPSAVQGHKLENI